MPKFVHDDVLDAPIDKIIAEADRVICFNVYSTVYATVTTPANIIAEYVPTITKANGDASGRKGTLQAVSTVNVDNAGQFNHYAIVDDTGTKILYIGTGTQKNLDAGDKVDCPQADIEFNDPT
ncbi:hypothetical protein tloyanaT_12940 [Thalassotalea loyana]|uniref:Uncharacterized protein n=1 Tax=Thalassotalea loyana TaxID=280483 RepID=A0ABQ6HBQ7_9GAMM|nr:hypothetical protein [Thalassotalea loyana]GLX85042.1 hypothetical protein tloyanaT_12940 [Thalassotalea loyana]